MYASSKSVTAENGKILTPTRTGKFLVDLNGPGILRDEAEKLSFVSLLKRLFDINYLAKDTFFCNPDFT